MSNKTNKTTATSHKIATEAREEGSSSRKDINGNVCGSANMIDQLFWIAQDI
jgi:hypothetical protein